MLIRFLILISTFIIGCSKDTPADPMCRTSTLYTETKAVAATCLIKSQVHLLAIKIPGEDRWDLPKQKLQNAQSAQCTAHSAVWKTTGLNVEVGKLLLVDAKQTHYFDCKLTDPYASELQQFSVPPWASHKATHIALIDPFATSQQQWVETLDLIALRQAYTQIE